MLIGPECCRVTPMHTDSGGNLTKAISMLKEFRDEHVRHTQGESESLDWWNWLFSTSWKAILIRGSDAVVLKST